jgi:hypothetical protein
VVLRAGAENLTDKQLNRLVTAIEANPAHEEVYVAWRCAQDLRAAYRAKDITAERRRAERILATFHTCPILEVARLGRTPRRWRDAVLAYFDTSRANNGGTEADQRHHRAPPTPCPRLPGHASLPGLRSLSPAVEGAVCTDARHPRNLLVR